MSVVSYYRADWALIAREVFDGADLTIIHRRWLGTEDESYGALFGPQALAARMFGRLNPHWYLDGSGE